jgi:small-conductance mechanosensitive channel
MYEEMSKLFIQPVMDIWEIFLSYVPNVVAALLFILVGLFLARVCRSILEQFFGRIKMDRYTSRIGINEILARFGLGKSPSYAIAFAVYWAILLVFFVSALNVMNLTVISQILQTVVVQFVPKIIVATMVAFGGLMLAKFMSDIVLNSSIANNLKGGRSLSKIIHFVVLVFTAIIALDQLGIEMKIIRSSLNILLGSIGLAFALAMGLGAKDVAREIVSGMFTSDNKDKK